MDIVDVAEVLVVADWPKALGAHDIGKTENGIQRCSQLVAYTGQEFRFLCARHFGVFNSGAQFGFGLFPLCDVAQDGAVSCMAAQLQSADGHEQRDFPALRDNAGDFAAIVEDRCNATVLKRGKVVVQHLAAGSFQQVGERFAGHLRQPEPEKRFCSGAEIDDLAM